MSDFNRYSRVNKFEKRRKNTKIISALIVVASILVVVLIGLWIFGPDDETSSSDNTDTTNVNDDPNVENDTNIDVSTDTEDNDTSNGDNNQNEASQNTEESGTNSGTENQNNDREQVTPSGDDENVIDAFTENWEPIGTEQEGPHTIVYDEGSQDRIEMEQAIRVATGLGEEDMITWWLQRGGDQQVIGTVSNRAETEIYRVYLTWVDNEGWQPTLVEVLKENDQKWRFE